MKHPNLTSLRSILLVCVLSLTGVATVFGAAGDLDTSFGDNGVYTYPTGLSGNSLIKSTGILPDGRIVFAGYATQGQSSPMSYYPTVEMVLPNGMPDPSFGTGGAIRFPFLGSFYSVAIQSDGKLLLAGYANGGSGGTSVYLLMRCNPDGSLDTTFNLTGIVHGSFGEGHSSAMEVLLRPDGKILVVGKSQFLAGYAAAQHNANGTLDTTFGNLGIGTVPITLSGDVVSAVLQPDGKVVIAGTRGFTFARLLANGAVDTSFGNGGYFTIPPLANASAVESSVKLQPDGKILVAGWAYWSFWFNRVIVRLNADGSMDSSFGSGGVMVASQGSPSNVAFDLELQPNGKIVIVGYGSPSTGLEVWRYNSNGTRDFSFVLSSAAAAISSQAKVVTLQPNGDMILAVIGFTSHKAIRIKGDASTGTVRFDFDGDGRADISGFRPSNGNWTLLRSGAGNIDIQWGLASDTLVPADYDGDGKTNVAIYRSGAWKIILPDGSYRYASFGQAGDLPRPGDFDGDGKADIAFWRPADGTWNWINSSNGHNKVVYFGANGDVPLIADIDGDFKTDQTIFRPSTGDWYYLRSSDGHYAALHFGATGDIPVVGDFDGDGKTDISVFRPSDGVWHRLNSTNGHYVPQQFGMNGDIPVPADYNGDGRTDIAVFRPSNNIWYVLNSGSGITYTYYGLAGDRALPSVFLP